MIMEILKNEELLKKLDEAREMFKRNGSDMDFLGTAAEQIEEIEDWKYSTGPIFNQPPYTSEMSGFSGGRLLKKKYPSPYEARLKGAYSSGFVKGEHRVTVYPKKLINMPLHIVRFRGENDILYTDSIYFYSHRDFTSGKVPELTSTGIFYKFDNDIYADIGVGVRNAYSITIYYYKNNLIKSTSMVTAPFNSQSECEMHYDEDNLLMSITTSGGVVWERGQLRAME